MFFGDYKKKKIKNVGLVSANKPAKLTFPLVEFMTGAELWALPATYSFIFDTETYNNFFFAAFKCVENGKLVCFEKSPTESLDVEKLSWLLHRFKTIGFNNLKYDNVILAFALKGFSTQGLKAISDDLIINGTRPNDIFESELAKGFNVKPLEINCVDLIEVCPLSASLKTYAARLHCKRMQDLPIDPHITLTETQAVSIRWYCINDLDNTLLTFNELKDQLSLRDKMSEKYQTDLRSKSDAQIAESVIVSELKKIKGRWPKKPKVNLDASYFYRVPRYINFTNPSLVSALDAISKATFTVDGSGKPLWPKGLGEQTKNSKGETVWVLRIKIGNTTYKLGMGGLHSEDSCSSYVANDNLLIIDRDVESFYPRIILNQKLYPQHLGEVFLEVYNDIVETRLAAKHRKDNVTADSLKIVINGSFGKFGSKWSKLYSPDLLLQVTISGQLSLLMLIEQLEAIGFKIVSANTDGIVILCPKDRYEELNKAIEAWEKQTDFKTEETQYKAIYSRDVNNYLAIKMDDKPKLKGAYGDPWSDKKTAIFRFHKNPEHVICSEALSKFLISGTPIKETIENCKDICKFVIVRAVKGGAEKDGHYLGKVVRWYFAKGEHTTINYVTSGNKVPKSDGSRPLMELPDEFPNNVDYDKYINIVHDMLSDVGYYKKATLL